MSEQGRFVDPGPGGWFVLGVVASWVINKGLDRLSKNLKVRHAVGVIAILFGTGVSAGAVLVLSVLVPILFPVFAIAMGGGTLLYRVSNGAAFGFFIGVFLVGGYIGVLMIGGGLWAMFPESRVAGVVKRHLYRIRRRKDPVSHDFAGRSSMGLFLPLNAA